MGPEAGACVGTLIGLSFVGGSSVVVTFVVVSGVVLRLSAAGTLVVHGSSVTDWPGSDGCACSGEDSGSCRLVGAVYVEVTGLAGGGDCGPD